MGQEGSKLDGGEQEPERIILQVPEQAAPEEQTAPRGPSPSRRQAKAASSTPSKTQWMRPSQAKATTTTDIRRAPSKPAPTPGRTPTSSNSGTPPNEAVTPAEAEYTKKLDSTKRELVKKIATQIKSLQIKDPASLAAPRVPVAKQPPASGRAADSKRSWLGKLTQRKAAALQGLGAERAAAYLAPLDQDGVGGRVEGSLGPQLEQFGAFQGALHDIMQAGVPDEVLDQFFFDEEEERALPTYQKWRIIRHAAEQVLAVYANRSNSQWIEDEAWAPPNVLNTATVSASMYSGAVDGALAGGGIALMFIDDGRLAEMGGDDVSPLAATDLWQAVKELAPHKVPTGQRLERLSVAGRHLLHAAVSVEMWYGAAALKQIKVVLAIDCDCEYFVVNELAQWGFFGLHHENVVLLPLPRFHGFAQDLRSGHLAHVKGSPRLMLGTGYAMFLLNSPAEAYTLSEDGTEPQCLQGSVLEWLSAGRASWLYTGLLSDCERLRPEALLDMDFLAAGLYAADRAGANMAMEVVLGEHDREARLHDSIALGRLSRAAGQQPPAHRTSAPGRAATPPSATPRASANGSPAAAAPQPPSRHASSKHMSGSNNAGSSGGEQGGGGGGGSGGGAAASCPSNTCNLRVSSMKTMRGYQLLSSTTAAPHGFYVATHRYAFSVKALQRMLVDAAAFHADVYLQGFYAYATFDISDLTTFASAQCAAILSTTGFKGPVMSEVIYGREWLSYVAGILQLQDGVKEFRRKAIQLYDHGRQAATAGPYRSSTYKEKLGFVVQLVLTPEHGRLARPALRLARLFVAGVADRLQVVVVAGEQDSKTRVKELLESVSDRELEFGGQLSKEVLTRPPGCGVGEVVAGLLARSRVNMVVIPSERLCGVGAAAEQLGQLAASAALGVARAVTSVPVLVVKANTVGRYLHVPTAAQGAAAGGAAAQGAAGGGGRDVVTAMVHLDGTAVGPLVEAVSGALAGGTDGLILARTGACERDGALSMRSRRLFVQARMAVAQALRVEERAYAGGMVAELPKAVEAEGVDLLAVSCPPDLPLSKELEQLLLTARTSILMHRQPTTAPPASSAAWS